MNNNIDLTRVLKDCPKGTKLYSTIFGEVEFQKIEEERNYPIVCTATAGNNCDVTADGRYYNVFGGECILFPSKDQRDWSKFTAPWLKKERDTIASLEEQSKEEYRLKSSKDEDVRKFMQYIEKQAKAYEFNLPNRSYDIYAFAKDLLVWLEKQGKKSSWKPSKEEMDVLYSLSYITNKYDEHKEDVITHLYQDLKREFFNDSSYENMFSLDNKEDDVRRRSTIQVLEYARSLDAYNQYGKADIDKNIAWLEKQGEQEEPQVYETEDGKIITYSETDGYKFVEPNFHEGQWIACKGLNTALIINIVDNKYEVEFLDGNKRFPHIDYVDRLFHLWTIQDARNGDVLVNGSNIFIFNFINNRRLMGYCHVNMDDGNFYNDIGRNECFCTIDAPVTPATKEQHDAMMKAMNDAGYKWNTTTKTLEKLSEPKFDPKTLNLFDKVLVKMSNESFNTWYGDFVAEPSHAKNETPLILGAKEANMVIPYNDDTKHLIGTTDEAPEYYRYWED